LKRRSRITEARIVDIAPTLMYLAGCTIPEDMDGKVLSETMEPDFINRNPPKLSGSIPRLIDGKRSGFGTGEDGELMDRLKGLGYIGE